MGSIETVEFTEQQIKDLHRILWKHQRSLEKSLEDSYFEDHESERKAHQAANELWVLVDSAYRRIQNKRIDASSRDLAAVTEEEFIPSIEPDGSWQEVDSEEAVYHLHDGCDVRSMEWNDHEFIFMKDNFFFNERGTPVESEELASIRAAWHETGWEVRSRHEPDLNTEFINDR